MANRKPFDNGLTPAQAERLALLAEECGELVQAIGKVLRHGYDSHNPNDRTHRGNRADVEREAGQVIAVIDMMCEAGELDAGPVNGATAEKRLSVRKYLHHASQ